MPRGGTLMTRSQADGVEGVVDEAQVGHDVLDLAALVEAGAAHQPVGDVRRARRPPPAAATGRWCGT